MSHYACRICRSSYRKEIEQLLSQKLPFRNIARRFVNTFSINLHALEQSINCHRKHFKELSKQEKELLESYKKGGVTNDEVEKLLHISDATATRYLEQLEKEGKVKQEGRTGKSVSYSRI